MSVTVPDIDSVLEYVPYSVRLAAKRAQQIDAAAASKGIDRRVHQRIRAADLTWLRGSRVKNGPDVTLVDLSAGGALLDSDVQLKPGAVITLEIVGTGTIEVRSEVLRCQIAALRDAAAVYRGALVFKSSFDLDRMAQLPAPVIRQVQAAAVGQAWQKIVVRYRDGTPQGIYARLPSQPRSLLALAEHQCHGERACARAAQSPQSGVFCPRFRWESPSCRRGAKQ